jgi:hypothetical protein
LDPSASDADKAAGTREGYVEVITMGDIAKPTTTVASTLATALFTQIKHKSGVAPCDVTILKEKIGGTTASAELLPPTVGIAGDWILLNQTSTAAWSGSATALKAVTAPASAVFWPQTAGDVTAADVGKYTTDPLLVSGVVPAQYFDLPDMSTPYGVAYTAANAIAQADGVTGALAKKNIANQYVTDDGIAAVTDLLFSQPTRRYHVAVNYTARKDNALTPGTVETTFNLFGTKGTDAVALFRNTTDTTQEGTTGNGSAYYQPSNIVFPTATSRTLCLNSVKAPGKDNRFDREETTPATTTTDFTISPVISAAASTVYICGEAAVVSINAGGVTDPSALGATVARNDITFPVAYTDGWLSFSTLAADGTSGLPILGQAFIRAANGAVNYGIGYAHKTK